MSVGAIWGIHFSTSSAQGSLRLAGQTTSTGPSLKYSPNNERACTVFPTPISSAIRQRPSLDTANRTPSLWKRYRDWARRGGSRGETWAHGGGAGGGLRKRRRVGRGTGVSLTLVNFARCLIIGSYLERGKGNVVGGYEGLAMGGNWGENEGKVEFR